MVVVVAANLGARSSSAAWREALALTEAAANRICKLLDHKQKEYLCTGIRVYGSNGHTYTFNNASEVPTVFPPIFFFCFGLDGKVPSLCLGWPCG